MNMSQSIVRIQKRKCFLESFEVKFDKITRYILYIGCKTMVYIKLPFISRGLMHSVTGAVTLLCLGPLTNIALAIRMDPSFCGNIKEVFIMGGNTEGKSFSLYNEINM